MLSPEFLVKLGRNPALCPMCERQVAVKIDRISTRGRAPPFVGVTLVCASALLSGCMGSPTYGTGKSANQQLVEDLTGVLSITPSRNNSEIAYNPRPELVRPATLEVLPEPQAAVASADNPAWPESPEQRRARLRAEATENQENAAYRSPITSSGMARGGFNGSVDENGRPIALGDLPNQQARLEAQRRARAQNQGDPNARRYLSEPPIQYRRPAETAAAGELGEDEWAKDRRRSADSGGSWRDLVPWL